MKTLCKYHLICNDVNDNCYGESVKKCIWYKNYEKYGEDFNQLGIGAGENLEKIIKEVKANNGR